MHLMKRLITEPTQLVYKPPIILSLQPISPDESPADAVSERWEIPANCHHVQYVMEPLTAYLNNLGFNSDWVNEFAHVVCEAITNACQHGTPGTLVKCIMFIVEHHGYRFCSVVVDNDLSPHQPVELPRTNQQYNFLEEIWAARGRGVPVMEKLADGLIITVHPGRTIQTALEKDVTHTSR